MMINSDNYNFIMINSHSCYYALHAICFNGMSMLISVRIQKKLQSDIEYIFIFNSHYFLLLDFNNKCLHYYDLIINSISFAFYH